MTPPPQAYFAAYTDILRTSLLTAKSLLLRNTGMIDNVKKATSLLEAVAGVPELLFQWEADKEHAVKRRLEYFDSQWVSKETDFSLLAIYRKHIG